ncbi:MAG: replication protein [Syntrophomonas sp.]|nr:replication protein [Syntrophomonas sp.]
MPRGDREIFKADCEDGFTRIANLILEALTITRLNATQMGICLFLLRRTYGWNRSEDAISLGDFASACGTSKAYISRQLADLLHKKIIRRLSYEPGKTPVYAFTSRIAEWDAACINLQALLDNANSGVYDCAVEGLSNQTSPEGYGLSDQTTVEGWGLSDRTSYGLSNRIRVGLSDQTTHNQVQTLGDPAIATGLKTVVKTVKEKELYTSDTLPYQLAELLLLKILEHLPGFKKPDLQKWSKSMDAILRLDKRPPEEVKQVILFAQGDSFWQANILSVDKLRKHYDRLNSKRLQARASPPAQGVAGQDVKGEEDDEYKGFFQ